MPEENRALHQAILEEPAAAIDEARAAQVSLHLFGLSASAQKLGGERDVNFRLDCEDGRSYLLKVSHPSEDRAILDFQIQAMQRIESRDQDLACQRVIAAPDGQHMKIVDFAGRESVVRLLSYIDGPTWHDLTQPSVQLAASLGSMLARLNRALNDFQHPAQDHISLWDIKTAPEVLPLAEHIPDTQIREIVRSYMSEYLNLVPKRFDRLPWQVIHGDVNPRNIIVSAQDHDVPTAIIDFGDMVYSPRIFDLAILCAYSFDSDGYQRVKAAARAYHNVNPLTDMEKEVLLTAIKCRLCLMLSIAYWRSKLHPENIEYIQRSTRYATRTITLIAGYSPGELEAAFADFFHEEPTA